MDKNSHCRRNITLTSAIVSGEASNTFSYLKVCEVRGCLACQHIMCDNLGLEKGMNLTADARCIQCHGIGCTEDQLQNSSLFSSTDDNV